MERKKAIAARKRAEKEEEEAEAAAIAATNAEVEKAVAEELRLRKAAERKAELDAFAVKVRKRWGERMVRVVCSTEEELTTSGVYNRECPICIEPFGAPSDGTGPGSELWRFPCGHGGHEDCLVNFLRPALLDEVATDKAVAQAGRCAYCPIRSSPAPRRRRRRRPPAAAASSPTAASAGSPSSAGSSSAAATSSSAETRRGTPSPTLLQSSPNARVFVSALPEGVTDGALRRHFGKFGALRDVCLPRLPGGQLKTDRQGRVAAEFCNALARDAALSAAPHRICAEIAEVRPAAPTVSSQQESATSNHGVFVGLVPTAYGVTEASQLGKLREYFGRFGAIDRVDLRNGMGGTIAFVHYADASGAAAALDPRIDHPHRMRPKPYRPQPTAHATPSRRCPPPLPPPPPPPPPPRRRRRRRRGRRPAGHVPFDAALVPPPSAPQPPPPPPGASGIYQTAMLWSRRRRRPDRPRRW